MTKLDNIDDLELRKPFLYRRKDGQAIVVLEIVDIRLENFLVKIIESSHPKIPHKTAIMTWKHLEEGTVWVGADLDTYFTK